MPVACSFRRSIRALPPPIPVSTPSIPRGLRCHVPKKRAAGINSRKKSVANHSPVSIYEQRFVIKSQAAPNPMRTFLIAFLVLWNCGTQGADIHQAIWDGDFAKVKAMLKENPDLAGSRDENGSMPLHAAAFTGQTNMVELLLSYKADVNAKNRYGYAPLRDAAAKGQVGRPLYCWRITRTLNAGDNAGVTALHVAAEEGQTEVARLLLEHKAKPM